MGLHAITSAIQGSRVRAAEPAELVRSVSCAWGEVSFTARRAGPSMMTSPILSKRTARMFRTSSHPFIFPPPYEAHHSHEQVRRKVLSRSWLPHPDHQKNRGGGGVEAKRKRSSPGHWRWHFSDPLNTARHAHH